MCGQGALSVNFCVIRNYVRVYEVLIANYCRKVAKCGRENSSSLIVYFFLSSQVYFVIVRSHVVVLVLKSVRLGGRMLIIEEVRVQCNDCEASVCNGLLL
jgi:hypothetical protein